MVGVYQYACLEEELSSRSGINLFDLEFGWELLLSPAHVENFGGAVAKQCYPHRVHS